jgi:hypothetical protein
MDDMKTAMNTLESDRSELLPRSLPDLWVAINPREAFLSLRNQAQSISRWQSMQRPLLIAFVIGCAMRLLASAPLSLWLVLSTTSYWAIVPLSGFLGLVFVIRSKPQEFSRAQLIDWFFTGHAPWLLWWTALATLCSLLSPVGAESLVFVYVKWVVAGTILVIIWSAYIDYCFFRAVLGRMRSRACCDLAIQRLVSWSIMIAVYTFGAFCSEIATQVGR